MDDDYSSDDDLDDDDDEAFLNDTSEFLLEDLGVLFSDDGSSDYDAMLVDDADGSVINLDTTSESEEGDPTTMEEGDEDTESYYDTGPSSLASSSPATVDSRSVAGDDEETMDAGTGLGEGAVEEISAVEPSTSVEPTPAETVEEDVSASTKRAAEDADDDEGQTCLICMEAWSNSGVHRLASLRCGHLFGQSCITRWLKVARARNQRRCPQCNKYATLGEVRPLYARKLVALDTAERDRLAERLEAMERERNRLDLELKKSQLMREMHERQLSELKARLAGAEAGAVAAQPPSRSVSGTGNLRMTLAYGVDINKEGGCRVLAYSHELKMVVVSQRSTNNLFSGYGISKMNSLNFGRTQFVFLHTKQIRDLAFNERDSELLLSVSLDRCAKLLDIGSNNVVQSYQTDHPLWSCCWDADDSNLFYAGCQNGSVLVYDVRQTGGSVGLAGMESEDVSPVTSLAAVPAGLGALPRGGLLACHFNSCQVYERSPDGVRTGTRLPLDGPFVSMRYDRATRQVLVSSRPSTRSLRARHVVCELARAEPTGSPTCQPIRTFEGSTTQNLMSRPCQMRLRGYGEVVAGYLESSGSVTLWSMADGRKVCNQAVREPVLDLCPMRVNDDYYLGTLSERVFQVYKVDTD